jgi:hypothetical protein
MSTAIAKNLMAEMKLLGMFAAYDQAVTDATRDQTGYSEFLDTLLQAETDYRQERKTGYRIKAAKWAAPGFVDTLFRAMMLNEVKYGSTIIQPRVQARGGQAGERARGLGDAGREGSGAVAERPGTLGAASRCGSEAGISGSRANEAR